MLKQMMAVFLVASSLVVLPFMPLHSFEKKTDSSFVLHPGDYHLWNLDDHGSLSALKTPETFSSTLVQDALAHTPDWLKEVMWEQFRSLDQCLVLSDNPVSIALGELNNNNNPDLLICKSGGKIDYYQSHSRPGDYYLKFMQSFQLPIENEQKISLAIIESEKKGFDDLFYAIENSIFRLKNMEHKTELSFSSPELVYTFENPDKALWSITSWKWENQHHLILGLEDGSLALLSYQSGLWKLKENFFPYWEEKWGPDVLRKGVYVNQKAQPAIYSLGPDSALLLISGADGDIVSFRISGNPPLFISQPLWDKPLASGSVSIAFLDTNGDGREDLLYADGIDPLSCILNHGTEVDPLWVPLDSQAENNALNGFFGGSGYHRKGQLLYSRGNHIDEIKYCAEFITRLDPTYKDEVIYCMAHLQIQDLLSYIRFDAMDLLVKNAQCIHEMANEVNYVAMEKDQGINTLKYATEEGWETMPIDIYYPYLVMLNRYLLVPSAIDTLYEGNFYRSYLPNDKSYGISLLSRVKEAKTLYEAAWKALYWLKVDIGGIWHMGEKPRGWYNIYHNLLNDKVGIWCGEWSIIYEAAARSVNIPTTIIVALGEDHQFNNFWSGTWQHADASSGEAGENKSWQEYIGDSLVYYRNWGQRIFSWPMAWEGNGKYDHVKRSELPYNPPEKLSDLTFKVIDCDGNPLDGARIELWSHWPMEGKYQPLPFISAMTYTDGDGWGHLYQVGHQNMTVVAVSRIGSVEFYLPLKETKFEKTIEVVIPHKIPELFSSKNIHKTTFDKHSIMRQKSIRFENKAGSEARIDEKTGRGYLRASSFSDFIQCSWNYDSTKKLISLKKPFFNILINVNSSQLILNDKVHALDHPAAVLFDQIPFLSLRALQTVFTFSIEWNADLHCLDLAYQNSLILNLKFQEHQVKQIQIPWIDAYFTRLRYLEYWKSKDAKLKIWIMDEIALKNFLAGESVEQGHMAMVEFDKMISMEMPFPSSSPLWVMVYNPMLCTSVVYDLEGSLQVP